MKITEEQVRYVAALANLSLSDAEIHRFRADLDGILDHVEKLGEVDTTDIAPMAQVLFDADPAAALRDDIPVPPLGNDAGLANAPQRGAGHFKVPKVIER